MKGGGKGNPQQRLRYISYQAKKHPKQSIKLAYYRVYTLLCAHRP